MTSIFKDVKPPFGKYYISNPSNNSIITVSDTKVLFESVYKNEYTKIELTESPTSVKDNGFDGSYNFAPVSIGSYKLYVNIVYAPSVPAFQQPYVKISYFNSLTGMYLSSFDSAKGVNQNPPAGFIPPKPTPATKSFFDKYFIYIAIVILLMIISIVGAFFFIKNRKPTTSYTYI